MGEGPSTGESLSEEIVRTEGIDAQEAERLVAWWRERVPAIPAPLLSWIDAAVRDEKEDAANPGRGPDDPGGGSDSEARPESRSAAPEGRLPREWPPALRRGDPLGSEGVRTLVDAGNRSLRDALALPPEARASAYRLLVADALLTGAVEAAADEEDPEATLSALLRRVADPGWEPGTPGGPTSDGRISDFPESE